MKQLPGMRPIGVPKGMAGDRGARGAVATTAGAVSCELEPLEPDERGAHYVLRVRNDTDGVLSAACIALHVGAIRPVAALAIEIEPHAFVRTGFALAAEFAYERVAAEIQGENVYVVVEAAVPRGRRRPRAWIGPARIAGIAAMLAGLVVIADIAAQPRVLDAALNANSDGKLVARWSTSGWGRRTYELLTQSGVVVEHGALRERSGTMRVARAGDTQLIVTLANSLGSDRRIAAFARATPPPPIRIIATPPPRLAVLAIDPLRANEPLTVHYDAEAARSVGLTIVDRSNHTWTSVVAPPGRSSMQIPAPPAGPRGPFTLIATAQGERNAASVTRVTVPTAPAPSPSPPPRPGLSDGAGAKRIAVRPDRVRPGRVYFVEVPVAKGARLALIHDRDGAQMYAIDLSPGHHRAAMIAPPRDGGPYTIHVIYQRGSSHVTVVRGLRYEP